jgi:rod shape-determining protein MreD
VTAATRLPPVLLIAVVLHTAVLPQLRLFGVVPDVLLLAGIAAAITAGAERGAAVAFGAGLLADCFLETPFGLSALAYSLAAYAVGAFQSTILHADRWIPVLTTFMGSALGVLLFAGAGAVLGHEQFISVRLATITLVVAAVNAVLALPAVRIMRWATLPGVGPRPALR